MGNASTKERSISPPHGGHHNHSSTNLSRRGRHNRDEDNGGPSSSSSLLGRTSTPLPGDNYSTRSRSRHNLESTLFGLGASREQREQRERDREAERELREQRKAEKEKERLKERERSLREESVDGGFLVTQGVYTGVEDFKEKIVRHLMIERRLAPFYKGLADHDPDWTDAQLVAAVKGLPIPPANAEQFEESRRFPAPQRSYSNDANLTVPIAPRSRAHSCSSDVSNRSTSSTPTLGFSSNCRNRSKTISISSPRNPTLPTTAGPVETNNPNKTIGGRPIEAVLYKNAIECPICFLYYPPYLNKTRCCDQEICSECFVQIKRADPHLPEHHDQDNPGIAGNADQLISEPATCPFCVEPDFGVTYIPPPFRRGLVYATSPSSTSLIPGNTSNDSSVSLSAMPSPSAAGKRRSVVPSSNPDVVTTDRVRPDWSQKLATARSHAARRAAAATALHTAAYLMSSHNNGSGSGSGSGNGGGFPGRRLIRRVREGGGGSETPSPAPSGAGTPRGESVSQAFGGLTSFVSFAERSGGGGSSRSGPSTEERLAALGLPLGSFGPSSSGGGGGGLLGFPTGGLGNRRSRMVDLEEMMLMEAIRLSLAEEEERKKREEKEAKKKEKEDKEKAGRRGSSLFSLASNGSGSRSGTVEGKGKSVDRTNSGGPSGYPGPSSASSPAVASTCSLQIPTAPSSSDSSSFTSFQQESGDEQRRSIEGTGSENAGSDLEPMYSFRSLAEMIVEEEGNGAAKRFERGESSHVENVNRNASTEDIRKAPIDGISHRSEVPRTGEPEVATSHVVMSPELEDKHLEVTTENLRPEQIA